MSCTYPTAMVRGLSITGCRQAEVRHLLHRHLASRSLCRIATVNLDFLRLADESAEVREALTACEYRLADGWPVLELARLAGTPLPERVTGAGLVPDILGWAREAGWRVGLVGGLPQTQAALAASDIWRDVICGHWLPDYRAGCTLEDPALCRSIRAAGADIVLVALGCPKQERWLHANLAASGALVGMGVGGSLEFLAGVRRRAPGVVQRLRLEFAWRLMQEPRRLGGRYLRDWWYWRRIRREAV